METSAAEHPGRTGEVNVYPISLVEQKFQHFLNGTARAGSVYGACGGQAGTWAWEEGGPWQVRRQPQIRFGCVCLAASFLAYWYNYNEDFYPGWILATGPGIHFTFHEPLTLHDVHVRGRDYESLRGYRQFVRDGTDRAFYNGTYHVTRTGTIADFINDGTLWLTRRSGRDSYFKWNPDRFADFNVFVQGSHHVILYVKRGRDGEHDVPGASNTPHQIWRLAADGQNGTPTTWREEEIRLRTCPEPGDTGDPDHSAVHDEYHTHGGAAIQRVALSPEADPDSFDEVNDQLRGQYVTFRAEIAKRPEQRWKSACRSVMAIWHLRDLRPDARAPLIEGYDADDFLDRPTRRIEIWTAGRGTSEVAVPTLTSISVLHEVDGAWVPVREGQAIRGGERIRVAIESSGVGAGTPVTVEVVDTGGDTKVPFGGELDGPRTEIEEELMNFIVPPPPRHQVYFFAWIYERDFGVASDWVDYEAAGA